MEVLPEEPVIASVCSPPATSRACTPAASRPSASTGSATTTHGSASSGRVVSAATAPAAAAAARKSCPSTRSPGTATNRSPAATVRESRVTAPVTAGRRCRSARRRSARPPRPGSARSCVAPQRGQHLAQDGAVVERVHGARDLLAGLVALAGDQQGVAGGGQRDRGGQGVAAAGDLDAPRPGGRRGRRPPRPASPRGWRPGPRSAGCRRSRSVHRCRRPQRSPSRASFLDRGRRRSRAR